MRMETASQNQTAVATGRFVPGRTKTPPVRPFPLAGRFIHENQFDGLLADWSPISR